MSDPDLPPPEEKPIPLLIWVLLGFVLMIVFMVALKTMNPPSLGRMP